MVAPERVCAKVRAGCPAYHTGTGLHPPGCENAENRDRTLRPDSPSPTITLCKRAAPRRNNREGFPMSIPASSRPSREWLLLLLALLIVGAIIAPMWQLMGSPESRDELAARWTPERLARLFLGFEQVLCYICAVWAAL